MFTELTVQNVHTHCAMVGVPIRILNVQVGFVVVKGRRDFVHSNDQIMPVRALATL
jgi:hypothetical protein